MNRKIVADSSGDMYASKQLPFAAAPLIINTAEKSYLDNEKLDVTAMVNDLLQYKGKSSTACPGVGDWLNAFGEADEVFCLTITSRLSGSYNSACLAKQEYESEHPGRRVYVVDSLSTGPEIRLLAEKIEELTAQGKDFDETCRAIDEYQKHTDLVFTLESLKNLANNGRVSMAVAKLTGLLGIRLVGKAEDGRLEPLDKCRGSKRAIAALISRMQEMGYNGGRVRIAHCLNPEAAQELVSLLKAQFGTEDVEIHTTGGLCSYYAEKGGMLVGFEH